MTDQITPATGVMAIMPGDWIRFFSAGRLVIGVVEYVINADWPRDPERYVTEHGHVEAGQILEVRRKRDD